MEFACEVNLIELEISEVLRKDSFETTFQCAECSLPAAPAPPALVLMSLSMTVAGNDQREHLVHSTPRLRGCAQASARSDRPQRGGLFGGLNT